jgi:hypothetical protein
VEVDGQSAMDHRLSTLERIKNYSMGNVFAIRKSCIQQLPMKPGAGPTGRAMYGLCRQEQCATKEDMESFLDEMRQFVSSRNPDAILLAEATVKPQEVTKFLQGQSRMHMAFNFFINQHIWITWT